MPVFTTKYRASERASHSVREQLKAFFSACAYAFVAARAQFIY